MIGFLRGLILEVYPPYMLMDVQGVGYEVLCPQRTLNTLRASPQDVSLVIETQVRPESLCLYGFETQEERQWFRLLQTVPGVGAKVAIALLSLYVPASLAAFIRQNSPKELTQAEGVGSKLATRIISELKDKLPAVFFVTSETSTPPPSHPLSDAATDAVSALIHLGYRPAEAHTAVQRVLSKTDEKGSPAFEDLLRQSLTLLKTGLS